MSYSQKAKERRRISEATWGHSLVSVDFSISDPAEFGPLREIIMLGAPHAQIRVAGGAPVPGEQGAADVLILLASSSGVVTAIRMLPEFLKARKSGVIITATLNGEPFTLTATNIDEVMPVLERILDA
jgi:hypothetical protein